MKNRVVLIITFCLICILTATAQSEKKPISNADVISMLEAGLSESTIVLAIQQASPNFDTSPQALIQLKNKGASPKVLDTVLQTQSSKSSTNQNPQNSDNSKQSPVVKASAFDFNFELRSCVTSGGDSIICTYTITNKDPNDRNLFIDEKTRMIDEFGNEYPVAERTLGKNKLDGYAFMGITLIPEVSVVGTLKFERVKPFSTIKALRISFLQSYSLASKSVNVDFFNIPINNSNYQGSTVGSTKQPTSSLDELIKISERFNEARVTGDKTALEDLLADKFFYYDQRFDKSTDRTKFIEKAKKGSVSSFNCSNYRLDKEPAGMPILRGSCTFKSRALLGMVDMSGTFSITFWNTRGTLKIFTYQVNAKPIQ